MKILLPSLTASMLLTTAAWGQQAVYSPTAGDPPVERSFHTIFTVEQNGVPTGIDERFASAVDGSFRAIVDGDIVDPLQFIFERYAGSGAQIIQFGDLLMRLQALAFDNETLTISTTFTRLGGSPIVSGPALFDVAVPDVWDEPLTAGTAEQLRPDSWLVHNVDGPWENPGVVVFDGTVEGDHYRVTLDRYGYFPADVVMRVPEPSGGVAVALLALAASSISLRIGSNSRRGPS